MCWYLNCLCLPCCTKLAQPAISRTNRTIRAETLSIFYGANRIYLNTGRGLNNWLSKIQPHLRFITEPVKIGGNVLPGGPNLKVMLDMGLDYQDVRPNSKVVYSPFSSKALSDVLKTQ